MKKIILLLALLSLSAIQAMDQDERNDDGLVIPAPFAHAAERDDQSAVQIDEPDYSQDPEVEKEYVSVEQAMAMFKKKEFCCPDTPLKRIVLDPNILDRFPTPIALPRPIARLIVQYVEEKENDSCDEYIQETPLYATHLYSHGFEMPEGDRKKIKDSFYEKIEIALVKRQQDLGLADAKTSGIPVADALMIRDAVWQELLKTSPFHRESTSLREWDITPDRKIIGTIFQASEVKDPRIDDSGWNGMWHDSFYEHQYFLVYDLESNQVIYSAKLPRECSLNQSTFRTSEEGTFTVEAYTNKGNEDTRHIESTLTYDPHSNNFSSKDVFFTRAKGYKTVWCEYDAEKQDFSQTLEIYEPLELETVLPNGKRLRLQYDRYMEKYHEVDRFY